MRYISYTVVLGAGLVTGFILGRQDIESVSSPSANAHRAQNSHMLDRRKSNRDIATLTPTQPAKTTKESFPALPTEDAPDPLTLAEEPDPAAQIQGSQEVEDQSAESVKSMRANGVPEQDIKNMQATAKAQIDEINRPSPLRASLSNGVTTEELRADLRKSLKEAGTPQVDIDNMVNMMFGDDQAEPEPPPPQPATP